MKHAPTANDKTSSSAQPPRNRRIRVSAMRLLAAGALCATLPATGADVTNAAEFAAALNNPFDENIVITGGDIDLLGQSFFLNVDYTQFFGDVTPRTLSNATITVTGSTSDTNYNLLNVATDAIFSGDIVLDRFSRLLVFDTTSLGLGATVEADENADIQLYSFAADTVTWDQTFFDKFTVEMDADPELISFSVVGPGTSVITGLPIFGAEIRVDQFAEFEFQNAPQITPTARLGATLAGSHDVVVEFGTLDLNDFDFTIDSLSGAINTDVTLGTGTLTTGDEQDTTYAGVISGTGNLVKTGTGTFTLTGVNTYSGTTTVMDGILALDADQTGPTAVIIQNGGTLQVNADQTGTPAYSIESGGTLDLFADLADTTGVAVDAGGQVNLNDIDQILGTLTGGGDVDLGIATLTIGDATDFTFDGVISGSGGLTKAGAGMLTLTGVNTYSGTTTIGEGTVTLDGDLTGTSAVTLATGTTLTLNGDIRDTASVTVGTGAILDLNDNDETIGTLLGTGDVTLGSATLTVGNGSNFTFGGIISETGGLTKQGNGTMNLTMAQTFTGATNIFGGTLVANGDLATSGVTVGDGATFNLEAALTSGTADVTVDDGGTFFGTATIADDLFNNGLVTFTGQGSGDTLTVNDDYNQGATGSLDVQLGNAGGLFVGGNADLGGTLNLGLPADPANFDINGTYTVIDAGSISGSFDTVNDDFAFLDVTLTNNAGNLDVTLARNAVAISDITRTTNQATVADVLDAVAPTDELESAVDRILASSEQGALNTLDDLHGGAAATVSTQVLANSTNLSHRLLDEVVGIAPATSRPTGSFSKAPGADTYDETDHYTLLSYYQGTLEEEEEDILINGMAPTLWASFYGGFGDQGDGAEGLDYTRYGLITGLELESQEREATYGLSIALEQSDFEFNQDNGDVDIQSIYISGYTRQPFGNNWCFTAAGTLGYHSHDSTRNILIGVTPTQASADFDSFSFSVAGEISKKFEFTRTSADPGSHPRAYAIEPFARLDYSISDQDGYSETGAGTAGLNVASNEFDSARAALGARVQKQFMLFNQYEATFQARALANFALSNSDSNLNVSFVGTPGSGFNVEGSEQDDLYGQIGFGLSVEINDDWDMHFGLDQQFSDDAMGTVLTAGLSYSF